ncbi:hypothetical protein [Roseomonas indoligenes]|uniref:Uncharacterized protein n=1 Tax=Roseomonas indoligenes TaxID=2820811 RepID=A0A940S3F3_9PROT|nr:hypothetical protein [Pararoseomonas indoligenes]MBP0492176.1 hypothetical protein [Pararoseomonas indoligenes]
MSNRSLAGRVSAFAHLAGFRKAKAEETPATTDEVKDVKDDVEDVEEKVEDLEDAVEDLEEKIDDVEGDSADDEPESNEPKEPEARKAYRKGRMVGAKAERARCSAIFKATEAGNNPVLAASLAFESDVPVKQAVALLKAGAVGTAAAQPRRASLDTRMAPRASVALGDASAKGPDLNTAEGMAAFVLSAGRKPAGK